MEVFSTEEIEKARKIVKTVDFYNSQITCAERYLERLRDREVFVGFVELDHRRMYVADNEFSSYLSDEDGPLDIQETLQNIVEESLRKYVEELKSAQSGGRLRG